MGLLASYPKFHASGDNGTPLSGGLLYTYDTGTSTLKTTYQDKEESIPHENPIVLDGNGEATIFLGDGGYKFVLNEPDDEPPEIPDNIRWTQDDIYGLNFASVAVAKTANYTLVSSDLDGTKVFSNLGAENTVSLTLSPGFGNASVTIIVAAAHTLELIADGTETIRFNQGSTVAGGKVSSDSPGTTWEVMWSGSEWVIVALSGVLDVDDLSKWSHRVPLNTNQDATSEEVFQLPSGSTNAVYRYCVAENQQLKIVAADGETISYLGQETAQGGYISSKQVGAYVQLEWVGDKWAITILTGSFGWDMSGVWSGNGWNNNFVSELQLLPHWAVNENYGGLHYDHDNAARTKLNSSAASAMWSQMALVGSVAQVTADDTFVTIVDISGSGRLVNAVLPGFTAAGETATIGVTIDGGDEQLVVYTSEAETDRAFIGCFQKYNEYNNTAVESFYPSKVVSGIFNYFTIVDIASSHLGLKSPAETINSGLCLPFETSILVRVKCDGASSLDTAKYRDRAGVVILNDQY